MAHLVLLSVLEFAVRPARLTDSALALDRDFTMPGRFGERANATSTRTWKRHEHRYEIKGVDRIERRTSGI